MPHQIRTARLILQPASSEQLTADLESPARLGEALGCLVPAAWPPELYDADVIQLALDGLRNEPSDFPWGFYYVLLQRGAAEAPVLVGTGGFKGHPTREGEVEIGYSMLAEFQRRGSASEAVTAWVDFAFSRTEVTRVVAQTLASLGPSIRVAEAAGLRLTGKGEDTGAPPGEEVLRYEITRAEFCPQHSLPLTS